MKKALSLLLAAIMLLALIAACGEGGNDELPDLASPSEGGGDSVSVPSPSDTEVIDDDPDLDGVFFKETRKITVEVFDRNNDPGTPNNDNVYTDYLKEQALKLHNIEITEYITMPRWDEDTTIPLWLAAGTAPDVCITYNFGAIQEYAGMGAVHDLEPMLHGYRDRLPYLWNLFTDYLIYYARDPEDGYIWWLETLKDETSRINTFVREDWLAALSLSEPKTIQQFEDMLIAFRDNAELLLGTEASKMIPFQINQDPSWTTENMMMSFVPSDVSDKDKYIYGYDDRHVTWPGYKEGVRVLNKWFNNNLVFKDFALYKAGASEVDDLIRAGYVGAFIHLWDYPYREDPSIQTTLAQQVGENAAFIAVDPFVNDAGKNFKVLSGSNDRKIFLPKTNTEPLASMLYIDMLSRPEIIEYLQLGKEGVNYTLNNGVPTTITYEAGDPGWDEYVKYFINSPRNLDLLMPINGLYTRGDLTAKALATSYKDDPRLITKAIQTSQNDGVATTHYNFGAITSESGMTEALKTKRDEMLTRAIQASIEEFDSKYDAGMKEYLDAGGQAIIDERTEKWEQYMG